MRAGVPRGRPGLAAAGGVEKSVRRRAAVRRAVATRATVVAVESEGGVESEGDVTWYHPVVAYRAGGVRVRARLARGSVKKDLFRVGQPLTVYFDPLAPMEPAARLGDFPGGGAGLALGAVFAALGGVILWLPRP